MFISRINAQILFSENFEGALNNTTKLPVNWQESGSSLDGIYSVGDSVQANFLLSQSSLWKVPAHSQFVMTNDVRCSYEKGIGFCDKSKDRLILPLINLPTFIGSLILQFDAFFTGKLGSQATIEVSLDGGTNWVKEFVFDSDETNWKTNTVNLSRYIGESNVLISFLYSDFNLVRDGLAIDNVVLKKQIPWNDVSLDYSDAAKYSMIPITQVDSIPLKLTIHNDGTLALDSVEVNVEVYLQTHPKQLLFQSKKYQKNVKVGDTLNVFMGKFLPTSKNKTYVIKQWVKTKNDTVSTNDTLVIPVSITQPCYARDNGVSNSIFDLTSPNSITIGNLFSYKTASYLDSVYFETNNATNGTTIQAFVFPVVNGKVSLTEIGKSDLLTLNSSNSNIYLKMKSLTLGRIYLDTGGYLIAIQKTNGGGSIGLKLCDNYYQDNTVFMRIGNVTFQTLDSYFSGTKKKVPIIRAFSSPFCKLSTQIEKINTKCQFATGELKSKPSFGKSPYKYLWNTGSTDSVITKLPLGKYSVKITDYYECVFDSTNITLNPFPKPIIEIDSLRHPLCYDMPNGYLSITTNNPSIITKVKWNGLTTNQLFINNAKSGLYTVNVVDGNNCEDSIKVNLINPDSIAVSSLVKDESIKSKGIISLFVSGGNPPYSYSWGDTVVVKNRTELNGDSTYTVVVTDTNGCKKTASIYVGSTVSLEEEFISSIKVFPNPSSDVLFVSSEERISGISVLDMYGKTYKSKTDFSDWNSIVPIDLKGLDAGVYFLGLTKDNIQIQFKFIKN